jgi:hypothetical protein
MLLSMNVRPLHAHHRQETIEKHFGAKFYVAKESYDYEVNRPGFAGGSDS